MIYPTQYDLKCYKGQTWEQPLYIKDKTGAPIDLTGATVKAQVRPSDNSTTLTAEMTCSLVPENGEINLLLSADVTANLQTGVYAYDVKVVDANAVVTYYIYGKFIVAGRVTV